MAVLDERADADGGTDLHLGDVLHEHRRTALFLEHDTGGVLDRADQAHTADQELLLAVGKDAAAGIGVVAVERPEHVAQRHAVVTHPLGVHQHVVLAFVAALGVDLGNARDRAQQRSHDPVLHHPALHEFGLGEGALLVGREFENILVNLAEAGGYRAEHRCHVVGQPRTHLDDAFHDQLSGEEHIDVIAEYHRDDGQSVAIQRAHVGQAGQSGHGDLERYGDEPLDFLRRPAGCLGRDLHLDVGHVREGVERELLHRLQAEREQRDGDNHQNRPLLQAKTNDFFHGIRCGALR